jgi:hypothetical protein
MKIEDDLKSYAIHELERIQRISRWCSYELFQLDGNWQKKRVQGTGEVKYVLNSDGLFIDGKKISLD